MKTTIPRLITEKNQNPEDFIEEMRSIPSGDTWMKNKHGDNVKRLFEEGMPIIKIASTLKISNKSVNKLIQQMNLQPNENRGRPGLKITTEELKKHILEGLSYGDIGKQYGVTKNTVRMHVVRRNLYDLYISHSSRTKRQLSRWLHAKTQ